MPHRYSHQKCSERTHRPGGVGLVDELDQIGELRPSQGDGDRHQHTEESQRTHPDISWMSTAAQEGEVSVL